MNCSHDDAAAELDVQRTALYRYCLKLTASTWEADDLVQETSLRVWSSLSEGRTHPNMTGLLLRTAKNIWIDQKRRNHKFQTILADLKAERPSSVGSGYPDTERLIRQLLTALSPLQTAVFLLREVFQYKASEVANRCGMTEGAVKALLYRARRSIERARTGWLNASSQMDVTHGEAATEALVRAYMRAFEQADAVSLMQLVLTYSSPQVDVSAVGEFISSTAAKRRLATNLNNVGKQEAGIWYGWHAA